MSQTFCYLGRMLNTNDNCDSIVLSKVLQLFSWY